VTPTIGPRDEGLHAAGDDPWWGEGWSFEFGGVEDSLAGLVWLVLLPGQGVCWYWAAVTGPGRDPVVVIDHDVPLPRGRGLEIRADALWADHIVEEPFDHVSVGCEAFALRLDAEDRQALAADPWGLLVGERTPFGLDLGWETTPGSHPVTSLDGPAKGIEYTLDCQVVGEVLVGDERFELDAHGARSHSWGERDWRAASPWRRAVWVRGR
jgi:hypothetical protein